MVTMVLMETRDNRERLETMVSTVLMATREHTESLVLVDPMEKMEPTVRITLLIEFFAMSAE